MTHITIERARGRWKEILPQLGIDPKFLTNRHGPCPLCGGRDRYRFDVAMVDDKVAQKDTGRRTSISSTLCIMGICGQCGAGNGIILIRKLMGCDFATACNEIDKIIGTNTRPMPVLMKSDADKRRSDIELVINDARSPEIVASYLTFMGDQKLFPRRAGPSAAVACGGQADAPRGHRPGPRARRAPAVRPANFCRRGRAAEEDDAAC